MAQRTVCLCDGKYIGIESIYTVIDGKQINIPDKLNSLRIKSRNKELFCPCGCGTNLTLVASDANLKEQHFRIHRGTCKNDCHMITEGKNSVNSKIVLKCWLDDKLQTNDVESRVPINVIGNTNRKYEFSFLSRSANIAISYSYDRVNLSDEKFDVLKANSVGIKLIYIVDSINYNNNGQYPEALMKIQDRQGYCLLLRVHDSSYSEATLDAIYYAKNIDGLWCSINLASGLLCDFSLSESKEILYNNKTISSILSSEKAKFEVILQKDRLWKEKRKAQRLELQSGTNVDKSEQTVYQKQTEIEINPYKTKDQTKIKCETDEFLKNNQHLFSQQKKQIRDKYNNRWIQCKICGLQEISDEFTDYGGNGCVNLGTCKSCSLKQARKNNQNTYTTGVVMKPMQLINRDNKCPVCGGTLLKKRSKYGDFMGCSNYPNCKFIKH